MEDRVLLCDDDEREEGTFKVRCCYEDHCNDAKSSERRIELRDVGASKSTNVKPGAHSIIIPSPLTLEIGSHILLAIYTLSQIQYREVYRAAPPK
jgi:hypothetical protein